MNQEGTYDANSLASDFDNLSVYRGEGAESSGSDGGSDDSFAHNGSVIAEEDIFPPENQNDAASTSTRSRDGLPLAVQKELVLAIKARGGIVAVKTFITVSDGYNRRKDMVLRKFFMCTQRLFVSIFASGMVVV